MPSAVRSPLDRPLAVIARRSGSRLDTALKSPLVPSTQPRASKRRPSSTSLAAVASNLSEGIAPSCHVLPRPPGEDDPGFSPHVPGSALIITEQGGDFEPG